MDRQKIAKNRKHDAVEQTVSAAGDATMTEYPPWHKWLPEHKEMLRGLWNDGLLTCVEITDAINEAFDLKLSKSAIIGRAHRMGLSKKESPIVRKPTMTLDRYRFIKMYNSEADILDIIKEFGLHTSQQVHYRAKKLGLKLRTKSRSRPERVDHRTSEHIHCMLKVDDPGIPVQTYERVNSQSKKWFATTQRCVAQPCAHYAVPTGRVCFEHGGMM